MRFLSTVCLCLLLLCGSAATGQELPSEVAPDGERKLELETDRDSFTPATSTVDRSFTLLEASYSFIDNRTGPEAHSFPELLVRYGATERLEARLGWNFEAGGPGTVSGGEVGGEDLSAEQAGRVLYGVKYQTSTQRGWTPESALIVEGYTPTSGPSPASTIMVGEAWGWTFANGWQWNSAFRFGTGVDKGDYLNQWAPSSVLKIPLDEKWSVHAEYFGIVSSAAANNFNDHYASFGGHVLLSPELELGIRIGFGLTNESPPFFSNVGFAWRF